MISGYLDSNLQAKSLFLTVRYRYNFRQWRIQTKRLGGSQIWGRQEGLHLHKYQSLSATIVGCHTKVVTFCRPKVAIFVGRTMRFFRLQLKSFYIINSEKV